MFSRVFLSIVRILFLFFFFTSKLAYEKRGDRWNSWLDFRTHFRENFEIILRITPEGRTKWERWRTQNVCPPRRSRAKSISRHSYQLILSSPPFYLLPFMTQHTLRVAANCQETVVIIQGTLRIILKNIRLYFYSNINELQLLLSSS